LTASVEHLAVKVVGIEAENAGSGLVVLRDASDLLEWTERAISSLSSGRACWCSPSPRTENKASGFG
jgi:hypothetical protein